MKLTIIILSAMILSVVAYILINSLYCGKRFNKVKVRIDESAKAFSALAHKTTEVATTLDFALKNGLDGITVNAETFSDCIFISVAYIDDGKFITFTQKIVCEKYSFPVKPKIAKKTKDTAIIEINGISYTLYKHAKRLIETLNVGTLNVGK